MYFRRVDLFDDPSEALPPEDQEVLYGLLPMPSDQEEERRARKGFAACIRQSFYASCWFHAAVENVRMWRQYAGEHGIVIRSTYSCLKAVGAEIPTNASIGLIRYGTEHLNPYRDNLIEYASTKGKAYAFEKEARLLLWDAAPEESGNRHIDQFGIYHDHPVYPLPVSPGLRHYVDVETIVKEVLVSPFASDSRLAEVQDLVRQSGYGFPVRRSDLTTTGIIIPSLDDLLKFS